MNIEEFNFSVDLLQGIIWQYAQAKNLNSIINQKQTWYDTNQSAFWQDWYDDVFNLLTANAFGISVWSYILNVPLYFLQPIEPSDKPLWGFNDNSAYPVLENTYLNFGWGNFSTRGQNYTLSLEEQRFLLRLRYFQLYTAGALSNAIPAAGVSPSLTGINDFLHYLVTTSDIGYLGTIYALDGLDMTMTYVFTGSNFSQDLLGIIQDLDIFPRPATVGIKVVINDRPIFGFNAFVGSPLHLENINLNFGSTGGNFAAI